MQAAVKVNFRIANDHFRVSVSNNHNLHVVKLLKGDNVKFTYEMNDIMRCITIKDKKK